LGNGEPIEVVEHRRTELVQPAVGELHLRLDADRCRDVPAADAVGQVVEQRALAGTRVASQERGPAPSGKHVGDESVDRLALAPASEKGRTMALAHPWSAFLPQLLALPGHDPR
jgi:hypothetical protein